MEVAQRLRLSKMTVYRLINDGELQAVRVGRSFRIDVAELDAYVQEHRTRR
jgi:excisionase family DNA binding protein